MNGKKSISGGAIEKSDGLEIALDRGWGFWDMGVLDAKVGFSELYGWHMLMKK